MALRPNLTGLCSRWSPVINITGPTVLRLVVQFTAFELVSDLREAGLAATARRTVNGSQPQTEVSDMQSK